MWSLVVIKGRLICVLVGKVGAGFGNDCKRNWGGFSWENVRGRNVLQCNVFIFF